MLHLDEKYFNDKAYKDLLLGVLRLTLKKPHFKKINKNDKSALRLALLYLQSIDEESANELMRDVIIYNRKKRLNE